MRFRVIGKNDRVPALGTSLAYLRLDYWDDWSKYRTLFQLYVFDAAGSLHELGDVKIGSRGLLPGSVVGPNTRAPHLDEEFEQLPEGYFSLGQAETYYETLGKLAPTERAAIFRGLRDLAFDQELFEEVANETVVSESLLRFVSASIVRTRFHRLSKGDARLTKFEFSYVFPPSTNSITKEVSPPRADFLVHPASLPPSNIHVVIGRNGVGKTKFMQGMARALLGYLEDEDGDPVGQLTLGGDELSPEENRGFAGLVCVSFSAFDDFQVPEPKTGLKREVVGLREARVGSSQVTLSPDGLADSFCESFAKCRAGLKSERWQRAVQGLYTDPVFSDANPLALLDLKERDWAEKTKFYFKKRLSSGHKIVLLTITRLVELVEERTLVLLDEPEGHLHPPLLSAFVRSLSDLLSKRNGVAIITTHSPVVLQEVPSDCVWLLERFGRTSSLLRPPIETFAENVGRLTREIFGLEVTYSGFHQFIERMAQRSNSFAELVAEFDDKLGAEGMAIARGMMARKAASDA